MSHLPSIQIQNFERVYSGWKSAFAHILVRTVAIKTNDGWWLLSGIIDFMPIPINRVSLGVVETSTLRVAVEMYERTAAELDAFLAEVRIGYIKVPNCIMKLSGDQFSEYAPEPFPVYQTTIPQLDIRSDNPDMAMMHMFNYERTIAELRALPIPFDGMADVLSFFGFGARDVLPTDCNVVLKLHPPVEVLPNDMALSQNKLLIHLLRKSEFAAGDLSLGLRILPNSVLKRRSQVASEISWTKADHGLDRGILTAELEECAAVVVMLTAAGQSVSQLVVADPAKSMNPRLQDYRAFDPNLENLNKALHVTRGDSRSLEAAIATLLFLHGANSITPPSSDAPDILAETPQRKSIIVECTTAFNDLHDKVGKLAGRRSALIQHHAKVGIQRDVLAILVVNTNPQVTSGDSRYLIEQQILLVTLADIEAAVRSLDAPSNIDELYETKVAELQQNLTSMKATHGPIG